MIRTPLDGSGFKWMAGSLILGVVLGICFTLLLRPGGVGGSDRPEAAESLKEGLALSRQLAADGKNPEALKVLQKLVERHPGSPEAYNNLAALQAAMGQLEASRELLEKGLRTNESYSAIYENLGVVYSEIARSSYGKALRLELPPSTPRLKVLTHQAPPATTARAVAPPAYSRPATTQVASAPAATKGPPPLPASSTPPAPAAPTPATKPGPSPSPAAAPPSVSAEAPAATAAPSRKDEEREVLNTLYAWARAWSDQDAAGYLSFYSGKFVPENGASRKAWEKQREQRLRRPAWIKVDLKKIILTPTGPDSVEVKMIQDYRAEGFKDKARKSMTLVRENGAWRIAAEDIQGR